jgi:hypothetical protein
MSASFQSELRRRTATYFDSSCPQLFLDQHETMDAISVGLEKTACLVDRHAVYELLYHNRGSAAVLD